MNLLPSVCGAAGLTDATSKAGGAVWPNSPHNASTAAPSPATIIFIQFIS
jgi:hypothetical protein